MEAETEAETKPTPSPWRVDYRLNAVKFDVEGADGTIVANAHAEDAALIAAAPELLEALRGIVAYLDEKEEINGSLNEGDSKHRSIARAAIAKAEGR